jgi:hypothetical protein
MPPSRKTGEEKAKRKKKMKAKVKNVNGPRYGMTQIMEQRGYFPTFFFFFLTRNVAFGRGPLLSVSKVSLRAEFSYIFAQKDVVRQPCQRTIYATMSSHACFSRAQLGWVLKRLCDDTSACSRLRGMDLVPTLEHRSTLMPLTHCTKRRVCRQVSQPTPGDL